MQSGVEGNGRFSCYLFMIVCTRVRHVSSLKAVIPLLHTPDMFPDSQVLGSDEFVLCSVSLTPPPRAEMDDGCCFIAGLKIYDEKLFQQLDSFKLNNQ